MDYMESMISTKTCTAADRTSWFNSPLSPAQGKQNLYKKAHIPAEGSRRMDDDCI